MKTPLRTSISNEHNIRLVYLYGIMNKTLDSSEITVRIRALSKSITLKHKVALKQRIDKARLLTRDECHMLLIYTYTHIDTIGDNIVSRYLIKSVYHWLQTKIEEDIELVEYIKTMSALLLEIGYEDVTPENISIDKIHRMMESLTDQIKNYASQKIPQRKSRLKPK